MRMNGPSTPSRIELSRRTRMSSAVRMTPSHGTGEVGMSSLRRGEIRWYTFAPPDKKRPVLLLTRGAVIDSLNEIIVAPVTRTIRQLATEVMLTPDDGMPVASVLNFDHVALAQRAR